MARGSPASKRKGNVPFGKFGEARESWLTAGHIDLVSYVRSPDSGDPEHKNEEKLAGVPEISLHIKVGQRTMIVTLTSLRLDELEALRTYLNAELDRARPYVETLDQIAEEAFANGDDSFARLYRPIPVIHHRQRGKPEHGEGVRERPPGLARRDGGDAAGPVGGTGGEVADGQSVDVVPEDDEQEGDVDQGVGTVGGEDRLPLEVPTA